MRWPVKPYKRERYPPFTPNLGNLMPNYHFICTFKHTQEENLSFEELKNLPSDKLGKYIPCNVRYGEVGNPGCTQNAYQEFGAVGIQMNYGPGGRH